MADNPLEPQFVDVLPYVASCLDHTDRRVMRLVCKDALMYINSMIETIKRLPYCHCIPLNLSTNFLNLKFLDLCDNNDLSDRQLADCVHGLRKLHGLNISNCKHIWSDTLHELGALTQLNSLRVLADADSYDSHQYFMLLHTFQTLATLSHIQEFEGGAYFMDDRLMEQLGTASSLTHLTLTFRSMTDSGISQLGGLTLLRHLELQATSEREAPFTLTGLESLHASLAHLSTHQLRLSPFAFMVLAQLTRLEVLRLGPPGMKVLACNDDLCSLSALTSLTHLGLPNMLLSDAALPYLCALPSLASLQLGTPWDRFTEQGLAALAGKQLVAVCGGVVHQDLLQASPSLRRLPFTFLALTNINDSGAKELLQMTGLRSLELTKCAVRDDWLARLWNLRLLTKLKLNGCYRFTGECIATWCELPEQCPITLTHLHLEEVHDLGAAAFRSIARWAGLKQLDLVACPNLNDRTMQHVSGASQLVALQLSRLYNITDHALEHLANMTRLQELSLCSLAVSVEGVAALSSLSALTTLHLSRLTLVGQQHIRDLGFSRLSQLHQLTHFTMWGCQACCSSCLATTLIDMPALRQVGLDAAMYHEARDVLRAAGIHVMECSLSQPAAMYMNIENLSIAMIRT